MITRHQREQRVLTSLLVVALTTIYVAYALTQPIAALQPSITYHFSQQAQPVDLDWPSYGSAAVGAVGYGVLETHGTSDPAPTASTIKVLTALAILHEKPLKPGEAGPSLTITQADMDSYQKFVSQDGSVVEVALGEELTEYDALEALLLPSANNIAETLARWAFGSIDAFNTYANGYAHELGMTGTTVTDPSGFDPATVSTPHDLVLLGEAAMANFVLAEIAAKPTATIPIQGEINNVNFLLGQDGVVGLKTGNSDQDPGAFLLVSKQTIGSQDMTIISVVMNGPNLWTTMHDSLTLLDSAKNGFVEQSLSSSTNIGTYTTAWHATSSVVPAKDQSVVLWRDTTVKSMVALSPPAVPAKSGTAMGTLVFTTNDHAVATVPLVLQNPIAPPDIAWRLSHPQ